MDTKTYRLGGLTIQRGHHPGHHAGFLRIAKPRAGGVYLPVRCINNAIHGETIIMAGKALPLDAYAIWLHTFDEPFNGTYNTLGREFVGLLPFGRPYIDTSALSGTHFEIVTETLVTRLAESETIPERIRAICRTFLAHHSTVRDFAEHVAFDTITKPWTRQACDSVAIARSITKPTFTISVRQRV